MELNATITFWTVVFAGISAIGSAITGVVTAVSVRRTRLNQDSKEMLSQATISLERAYQALAAKAESDGPPVADRTAWIAAARLLRQYDSVKKLVTSTPHRLVLEEQEEHWRHRFYLILQPLSGAGGVGYYSNRTPLGDSEEVIEPMSAVVIHTFTKWPNNKTDSLPELKQRSISPQAKFLDGNMGLRRYLENRDFIETSGR